MKPPIQDFVSLQELCSALAISVATGRNWIRLGKLTPQWEEGKHVYFTREYVEQLRADIRSGVNASLKSRRNKKYVSGCAIYRAYVSEASADAGIVQTLVGEVDRTGVMLREKEWQLLIADCAIQMFCGQAGKGDALEENVFLTDYLDGIISLGAYAPLVDALIENPDDARKFVRKNRSLFSYRYRYEENEDILGLLYLSGKNIASRKAIGSYYTPTKIVKRMIAKLCEENEDISCKSILDPCCGTGNFLLQLPRGFGMENIYANDIDEVSVKIARINLALKYRPDDIGLLYERVTCLDYLREFQGKGFDYVIGNPPWGCEFSEQGKRYLRSRFRSAEGKNIESYDVFIEKALMDLKEDGTLSFVLPEAVMNVRAHLPVRKLIAENNSIRYLAYLGNVFHKVQCPGIILQLRHTCRPMSCIGMEVDDGEKIYRLSGERRIDCACFGFRTTDAQQQVLDKILTNQNCATLKDKAVFALGIVTGSNREFLSEKKRDGNEAVLKGSDIYKYRIKPAGSYIVYTPERFQQVAPTEYYRAPEKLFYRFVGGRLVFAYDDRKRLSLNSCNILIPRIDGMSVKYVMTILNSRIAQFVFDKCFHSLKVLRSHIEQIPIPYPSLKGQERFVHLADQITNAETGEKARSLYDALECEIAGLFGLSDEEYALVKDGTRCGNFGFPFERNS